MVRKAFYWKKIPVEKITLISAGGDNGEVVGLTQNRVGDNLVVHTPSVVVAYDA